jgi:hypothetical protein
MFAEQWENRYDEAFPMKKRILITGVDRTGTSACAALVHALGGNLIFDAGHRSEFNPHGYFEPVKLVIDGPGAYKQFVDAHRNKRLWGVRNPRFCHFLNDFMDHFAPDEKVWVVYTWRNREETIASWERCHYPGHLHVDDLRDSLADQILKANVRGATIARVLYHDLFDNLDQVIRATGGGPDPPAF